MLVVAFWGWLTSSYSARPELTILVLVRPNLHQFPESTILRDGPPVPVLLDQYRSRLRPSFCIQLRFPRKFGAKDKSSQLSRLHPLACLSTINSSVFFFTAFVSTAQRNQIESIPQLPFSRRFILIKTLSFSGYLQTLQSTVNSSRAPFNSKVNGLLLEVPSNRPANDLPSFHFTSLITHNTR